MPDGRDRVRAEKGASRFDPEGGAGQHFIQVASHDLREPLRMMSGFCGVVLADYGDRLDDRGRSYLARAVAAADRMKGLLDNLAEFAWRDGHDVDEQWFEADDGLDRALENLDEAIRRSNATITRDPLPTIFGSAARFPSLFQNLIGNALKYARDGIPPAVHISCARTGDDWRFSVADNGVGVEPGDTDRIFEPFRRLARSESQEGSGLGLAICRRIIEDFGGRIWVLSEPGHGSTFYFTVGARERASCAAAGRPVEVLLIEDNAGDVLLTQEAFRAAGAHANLAIAADAESALSLLRQKKDDDPPGIKPDVILLDLNLPRMDGRELLRRLRADSALCGIKVIALTASDAEIDVAEARKLDVDGVASKPVDVKSLMAAATAIDSPPQAHSADDMNKSGLSHGQ